MTTRKTTPAAEAAAETPTEAKKPRTPRKPEAKATTARSTAKTTTARKTPAKAPATEAKKPRAKKPAAAAWADLYSTEPTAPTPAPAPAAAPAPAKPEPPVVEMTVTPVRGFARPKRHQLSFRMPTDIPPLLTEAQQLLFEQGRGQSRDLIVAEAIRQWVERERAAVARAKAKAKEPEDDA